MSAARDFQPRERTHTGATDPRSSDPLSPINSRLSHASSWSVNEGARFRQPSRSNTVKTYHEPERSEPVWQPGAEPGIDTAAEDDKVPPAVASLKALCDINIVDFSESDVSHIRANNDSLASVLEHPRPDDMPCRWISVNGLSWDVIKCLGKKYKLHGLAIEDIVHTHTRTKVDWYADHAYIVLTLQKLVRLHHHNDGQPCDCPDSHLDHHGNPSRRSRNFWQRQPPKRHGSELPYHLDKDGDGKIDEFINAHSGTSESAPIKPIRTLHRYESAQIPEHTAFMEKHSTLAAEGFVVSVEQVSIFLLSDNTVISFFEHSAGDVEAPIKERLDSKETMLRRSCDASLLCQAIIDAIVDLAVPVRDAYNKARKELQVDALIHPNIKTSRSLHIFGEEIDMLQNLFKPIVHLVNALRDHNTEPLALGSASAGNPMPNGGDQSIPSWTDKMKRDREGAPTFNRKLSDWKRTGPLPRSKTVTNVAITPLAHTYFGDVLDHSITMIQTFEQMDASATNITNLIFNTVSARTNGFMMILAFVTVIFAPLTFVSGYFGMNFASGKGLAHPFAFFWLIALPSLAVFMVLVFATMLWENISHFFQKRGLRTHRHRRNQTRRAVGTF
ncbi:hypothetical protein LTR37_018614 [Vermiconidia calcicola]|uniref:Uncharacterized protein n=1 Tax=Vermiconidia calcicola TaxID=1690605 RepID=A0ACC3MGL2_9PEZI|nr:hypothetical protein LTR37_018614 [Vermiconidia calcicola]